MNERNYSTKPLSYLFLIAITGFLIYGCNEMEPEDCNARTQRDQYYGYEVWAGDSAICLDLNLDSMANNFYNIDDFYTLIGTGSTTQTFNTGSYKYYVVVAKWYCCIDAIQFDDSSYLHFGTYTVISGLAEEPPGGQFADTNARFIGPPDGISGNLGYKDLCKEPRSFGGFITDNETVLSRGGGITVYVVNNCVQ